MLSNDIGPDLAITDICSSASMKIRGLITELHHKDCAHYMSSLFKVLVSHVSYILNSDTVIPDWPRRSSLKLSPPKSIPTLTRLVFILPGCSGTLPPKLISKQVFVTTASFGF